MSAITDTSAPEPAHSTIWLLSLQGELAMQIGTSLNPPEMLRSFLLVLTRRLQLKAAQVWWRGEQGVERYAYPQRSVEQWLAQPQAAAWCSERLEDAALPDTPASARNGAFRCLRVSSYAVLFFEEGHHACSTGALAVLEALMPRLAVACQACLDHRRSRALLELTRLQNRELQEARERTEAAWRGKNEFLAAISHEMRTPLNSVLGFSELLRLELEGEESEEYARMIYQSGRHLLAMFNDLMDLAKLDARRLVLHPQDIILRRQCEDVWMPHALEAQRKRLSATLQIAPDVPERIIVDPVRLRQILNNLLGNALKFTDHGSVRLDLRKVDDMVSFSVTDTGPGIPPDAQLLVFERFRQAGHGAERNAEGTGLGLAIARELAEEMGGFITLESAQGGGCCFVLMLPVVAPGLIADEPRQFAPDSPRPSI